MKTETGASVVRAMQDKEHQEMKEILRGYHEKAQGDFKSKIRNMYIYGQHIEVSTMDNKGNIVTRDVTREFLNKEGLLADNV